MAAALVFATGCASRPNVPIATPGTVPSSPASAARDTTSAALIAPGVGSLKQENIALRLQLPDVLVRLIPLDESVIRTLSADSYRALHDVAESRRSAIARLASQRGLLHANVWYVSFYGLAPEARFSPLELVIRSAGRDFRPVEALALTAGFGEQVVQPRETQSALLLFEEGVDVNQPLVISLGRERNSEWEVTLREIERERARIRSRAGQNRPAAP
ncbi:MAG: hypothetical protein H0W68_07625 [Gemmatimonadaceae bacterium]|nr:hypothetical protein [Gemmatimonadaceae bacterium]